MLAKVVAVGSERGPKFFTGVLADHSAIFAVNLSSAKSQCSK